MSEEGKETESGEARAPRADVPMPPSAVFPGARKTGDDEKREARLKMAGEVESGRTPFNYAPEPEERDGFGPSIGNIAAIVALVAILAAGFMGWRIFKDMSGEIDRLGASVRKLSDQIRDQREEGRAAGAAVTRSELKQTITALDNVIGLGDEAAAEKAAELKGETLKILDSIAPRGRGTAVTAPPVPDAEPEAGVEMETAPEAGQETMNEAPARAIPDEPVLHGVPGDPGHEYPSTELSPEAGGQPYISEPSIQEEGQGEIMEPAPSEPGVEEPLMEPVAPLDMEPPATPGDATSGDMGSSL